MKVYLSGREGKKNKSGKTWREEITPRLLELGIEVLDPVKELKSERSAETLKKEERLRKAMREHDWKAFMGVMAPIWSMHKKGIDEADFLIVYCDEPKDIGGGTVRELLEAYEYHKAIFLVTPADVSSMSSIVLYMVIKRGKTFASFDELMRHLKADVVRDKQYNQHHTDLFHVSQKLFVINDQEQLLVLKDTQNPYNDFAGGRLNIHEFDEPIELSLKREIEEELGTAIQLEIDYNPAAVGRDALWNKELKQPHYRHVFYVIYEALYKGGKIVLSEEHESYEWVPLATYDPSGLFKPGMELALKSYLERKRK